jgi:hypothetical protein
MFVCVYSVFVLSCVSSGLATGWSLVQGVLPIVYKCTITEPHKEEAKARNGLERQIRRSPMRVNERCGGTCRLLPASCRFLAWLILRPWIWKQYVPPKRKMSFNWIHGVISQKTERFITAAKTPFMQAFCVAHKMNHSFTLIYRTDGILPSCVAQHKTLA